MNKRIGIVIFGLSLGSLCLGQSAMSDFSQEGNATQEMRGDRLIAAHSSLPIGSLVIITNLLTGEEIEVMITARIPSSRDRIIDLSTASGIALGLENGGPVMVTAFSRGPRRAPQRETPPEPELPPPPPPPVIAVVEPEPPPPPPPPPPPAVVFVEPVLPPVIVPLQREPEPRMVKPGFLLITLKR